MAYHENVVAKEEEEEDLGAAMQKLQIPFRELEHLSNDSIHAFVDEFEDIVDDLLLEDFDPSRNNTIDDYKPFQKTSNHPTTTRSNFRVPPRRPRNKRGKQKRQCFKSASCLFDSKKSCSHCGTISTPLWREGPKGAGTLCNACGMRFRSGRLFLEYRPASSPDFKPNVHSNFHRKVMKIRRERNLTPNSFGSDF